MSGQDLFHTCDDRRPAADDIEKHSAGGTVKFERADESGGLPIPVQDRGLAADALFNVAITLCHPYRVAGLVKQKRTLVVDTDLGWIRPCYLISVAELVLDILCKGSTSPQHES